MTPMPGSGARMVETTSRSEACEADVAPHQLMRFDRVERLVHWTTALLFIVALLTGTVLYVGPLSSLVGRRVLMRDLHVYSGLLLPVPLIFGYAGRWRAALQGDVRRLARWRPADWSWLRHPLHHDGFERDKFNGGQKLFAAFVAGSMAVFILSGSVMRWFEPFPDSWRNGATFVHDWLYLAFALLLIGHIYKAVSEPEMLRSMLVGWVPERWARHRRPDWYSEVTTGSDARAPNADR